MDFRSPIKPVEEAVPMVEHLGQKKTPPKVAEDHPFLKTQILV